VRWGCSPLRAPRDAGGEGICLAAKEARGEEGGSGIGLGFGPIGFEVGDFRGGKGGR
jgi:hypothetical protein